MDSLKRGPLPKYARLAQSVRHAIRSGELEPGERLPTEEELCAEFGVSRGTVQQALRQLIRDGLVRRQQGRGAFVAGRAATPSTFFQLVGFSEQMRRLGRTPETRVLSTALQPAAARVAEQLALPDGTPVLYIARLRLADGEPVVYETRYMAETLCPGLLDHDLERESLHQLLTEHYQIPLVKMTHTVELRPLFPATAKILSAEPGERAFIVDRLTYTTGEGQPRPAVLYHSVLRANVLRLEARAAHAPEE
jgi:GntR family transcriptional regulator